MRSLSGKFIDSFKENMGSILGENNCFRSLTTQLGISEEKMSSHEFSDLSNKV